MSDSSAGIASGGNSGKDKYLAVAIHQIIEEYGWKGIEKQFGADHHMIYVKSGSPLDKVEVKAHKVGNRLDVNFLGITPKKGLLDKVFDFNVREIPKRFELHKYVSDDMTVLEEQHLTTIIGVVLKELEDVAKD